MDSYGSLEPDNEAWGPPSAPGRRPQRRAAEEAAFRTARYARTGEHHALVPVLSLAGQAAPS